jgi:hypothetical protein
MNVLVIMNPSHAAMMIHTFQALHKLPEQLRRNSKQLVKTLNVAHRHGVREIVFLIGRFGSARDSFVVRLGSVPTARPQAGAGGAARIPSTPCAPGHLLIHGVYPKLKRLRSPRGGCRLARLSFFRISIDSQPPALRRSYSIAWVKAASSPLHLWTDHGRAILKEQSVSMFCFAVSGCPVSDSTMFPYRHWYHMGMFFPSLLQSAPRVASDNANKSGQPLSDSVTIILNALKPPRHALKLSRQLSSVQLSSRQLSECQFSLYLAATGPATGQTGTIFYQT